MKPLPSPRPRRTLAFLPTPVVELPRLSAHLGGPRLFMKRDDQTGLALGGNKARKLEYLLGEAALRGADTVITGGAEQSNHCRQTAAAAAACGLECHLALGGEAPPEARGNLLLDELLGARLHWCGELRRGERIPEIAEELAEQGKVPYVIPYGGSSALGAVGFVEAWRELLDQCGERPPAPTHVVFASSSGGTHAGLLVGRAWSGGGPELVGIRIDKGEAGDEPLARQVAALARETAALLSIDRAPTEADVVLEEGYMEPGYGVVGPLEREAIGLTARLEGILLDPVYTGRAMGGLIDLIRRGRFAASDRLLFWHTGGAPALFARGAEVLEGR